MSTPPKKILISQPAPSTGRSPYYTIAERYGMEIEFRQLIKTVSVEASQFRKLRIDFSKITAIAFTSKTIIDCFFDLMKSMKITIPETMKYFCTNETVALYLQKHIVYRKRKVFFGESGHLADLVQQMCRPSHSKESYFIPISEDKSDKLPDLLKDTKLNYQEGIVYRTITRDLEGGLSDDYDIMLFFSPYGITALKELLPDFQQGEKIIGAFGELTAQAVENNGLRLDFSFTKPTEEVRSMAGALEYFLKQHVHNDDQT